MCGSRIKIIQDLPISADFTPLGEMGFLPKFLRCCGGYKNNSNFRGHSKTSYVRIGATSVMRKVTMRIRMSLKVDQKTLKWTNFVMLV